MNQVFKADAIAALETSGVQLEPEQHESVLSMIDGAFQGGAAMPMAQCEQMCLAFGVLHILFRAAGEAAQARAAAGGFGDVSA